MSKDADVAIRGCSRLIRESSDRKLQAQAHLNRGVGYANKGQDAQAIADYTEAIRLDAAYALPYWNRGKLYENDSRFEAALADATRYLELDPGLNAIRWKAGLNRSLGNDEAAVADYGVAIGLSPRNVSLYAERAATYQSMQRFGEAIADLTKALEIDHSEVRLHERAKMYFDQKTFDKTIEDCTAAIALDSQYDSCYELRGDAHLQLGDVAKALADATRAIELALKSLNGAGDEDRFVTENIALPYMYALRGEVHERSGEKSKAIADYRKALEKYEDHPRAIDGLKRLGASRSGKK